MQIQHYEAVCQTQALPLLVRGWHELLTADLTDGTIIIGWDHKAIVAFSDAGMPIGALSWIDQEWGNQLFIPLAYVLPEHRRQGVYTAMWNVLVAKAVELKRPVIASGTSIRNTACRATMAKLGRIERGIYTRFDVPLP
jgi:GNAT superfamily N-acetyltransferase